MTQESFRNKVIKIYEKAFSQSLCRSLINEFEDSSVLKRTKRDPYFVEKLDLADRWQDEVHDTMYAYLEDYKQGQWVERNYDHYMKDSSILKYREGDRRWLHAGEPRDRELVTLSTLVFLCDDCDGGILKFPDFDLEIAPETGKLVIFPSCYLFPHEVTPVTKGERYTLTTAYGYKVLGPNTGHSITQGMSQSAKQAKEIYLDRRKKNL